MYCLNKVRQEAVVQLTTCGFSKTQANLEVDQLLRTVSPLGNLIFVYPQVTTQQLPLKKFQHFLLRRQQHEPLPYIIQQWQFYSLDLYLNNNVLIPRPESELMVDLAIQYASLYDVETILDLGTGSGCLLLAALSHIPRSFGVGIDHSYAALEVAQRNLKQHNLTSRSLLLCSNWLSSIQYRFQVILANPPYISTSDYHNLAPEIYFEPRRSLCAGHDPLAHYKNIFSTQSKPHLNNIHISDFLAHNGVFILEVGKGMAQSVIQLAQQYGLCLYDYRSCPLEKKRALAFRKLDA